MCPQSRKEEALRKRRNIPEDSEDYQASLGPGFTLESLVAKAQSPNQDEQFLAVQATRYAGSGSRHTSAALRACHFAL